jgi:diaminopimelate epimerase
MCDRYTGIGADGLILYAPAADGATMTLLNADGSHAEVSGNGLRGLAALLLRNDDRTEVTFGRTRARNDCIERLGTARARPSGRQWARRPMFGRCR